VSVERIAERVAIIYFPEDLPIRGSLVFTLAWTSRPEGKIPYIGGAIETTRPFEFEPGKTVVFTAGLTGEVKGTPITAVPNGGWLGSVERPDIDRYCWESGGDLSLVPAH
jgi:hypothetical protein